MYVTVTVQVQRFKLPARGAGYPPGTDSALGAEGDETLTAELSAGDPLRCAYKETQPRYIRGFRGWRNNILERDVTFNLGGPRLEVLPGLAQ
eukprot:2080114-Rhodomonas_salina.1